MVEALKNIYWRGERVLGKAVFAAKCSVITWYPTNDNYYGPAVLWTLLGDPALRVKFGLPVGQAEEKAPWKAEPDGLVVVPNPARTKALASFRLSAPAFVSVVIVDAKGATVKSAPSRLMVAGMHRITLDRAGLARGIYWVRLRSGDRDLLTKVVFR